MTYLQRFKNLLERGFGFLKEKLWPFEITFRKRPSKLTFKESVRIRILALILGLVVVAIVFLAYGQNPLILYMEIFGYHFEQRLTTLEQRANS
jgi:hypothetical protein